MSARGITDIVWVDDLGTTPAMVEHETGVMYCSIAKMRDMPKPHRLFIMLHEMAHIVLQTRDEVACDDWAFKQYAKMGYPLSQSVKVLCKVLRENDPEHYWRMYHALERAKDYDRTVNHNTKV